MDKPTVVFVTGATASGSPFYLEKCLPLEIIQNARKIVFENTSRTLKREVYPALPKEIQKDFTVMWMIYITVDERSPEQAWFEKHPIFTRGNSNVHSNYIQV